MLICTIYSRPVVEAMAKLLSGLLLSMVLISCGGGGGGSGSSSSAAVNSIPIANAGEDRTVSVGDVVELKAQGTDSDGTITGYTWTQLTGPNVPLTAINLSAGHFRFVAPPTGTEKIITLEFRLRVTDNRGATGTDTVVFTVNRVNQPPTVNAGADQTVVGLSTVNLLGNAVDSDGSIVDYVWTQTEGVPVTLTDTDKSQTSFAAPSTNATITLSFNLTVTDDEGATASDVVIITVTPENAPHISLTFPPATGVYRGSSISAFGTVETKNDTTVVSVVVTAGSDSVAAAVDEHGNWRADNIPVPTAVSQFTLLAEVTDSDNLTQQVFSTLFTQNRNLGGGEAWARPQAVAVVPGSDTVYVLTKGNYVSDTKILPVNIHTGQRGASISHFTNAGQGPQSTALQHMIYDAVNQRLLLTNNPASDEPQSRILVVDIATGLRSILSDVDDAAEINFINLIGLSWGPDNRVLVADNGLHAIVSVDAITGVRDVIAHANTAGLGVDAPLFVNWDQTRNRLIVTPYVMNHYFLGIDNWLTDPFGYVMSSSSSSMGERVDAVVQGVSLDADNERLLVLSGSNKLIAMDLVTGNRTLLLEDVAGRSSLAAIEKGMDYDPVRQLLYVVNSQAFYEGLYVVDPQGGGSVLLSR